MDRLDLALRMRRLAAWLDRACQPAGFVQRIFAEEPFGGCYVSIDPGRQGRYASSNWNRVHLCGTEPGLRREGIGQLIAQFREAGVDRFFVWLSPGPDMDTVRAWLLQEGFSPRMQWTRYPTMACERLDAVSFRTDLAVREVGRDEVMSARATLGDTMWPEYERSAGKPDIYHFMAFDDRRPVAIGALAVFDGIGYLTAAATAEADRKRGAQSALIATRIERAREVSCSAFVVETLTMLEHSYRNLQRAGFKTAYEKEIYEWSAAND
jgi:GNAT superfamily N-acetyltransferase